jgi:hypothetical protein
MLGSATVDLFHFRALKFLRCQTSSGQTVAKKKSQRSQNLFFKWVKSKFRTKLVDGWPMCGKQITGQTEEKFH